MALVTNIGVIRMAVGMARDFDSFYGDGFSEEAANMYGAESAHAKEMTAILKVAFQTRVRNGGGGRDGRGRGRLR